MRTNRLRYAAATALTTGLLVPVAVFAGPGLAHGSASAAEYQYAGKQTICHHAGPHKTVTITVSTNALTAHRKHGDTDGACATTTSPAVGNGHGKAKGHTK